MRMMDDANCSIGVPEPVCGRRTGGLDSALTQRWADSGQLHAGSMHGCVDVGDDLCTVL